ncbi:hypothetical protein J3R03_001525 [Actinoplanes couchii]|nr:hypothetical protein [Actinoplanes couchii]
MSMPERVRTGLAGTGGTLDGRPTASIRGLPPAFEKLHWFLLPAACLDGSAAGQRGPDDVHRLGGADA